MQIYGDQSADNPYVSCLSTSLSQSYFILSYLSYRRSDLSRSIVLTNCFHLFCSPTSGTTVYDPPSLSRVTRRFTRRLTLALTLTGKHTHTQSCNPRRRYHPFRPHRQARHLHPTAILHLGQHELVRLRSGTTPYGFSRHSAHEPPLHRRQRPSHG